jgi:anti-sigma-K factor RskA
MSHWLVEIHNGFQVFDCFAGQLKMKSIANPGAFAITIEPRGGKTSPTLETLQVTGDLLMG